MIAWTNDRTATLTRMWADGASASQIATALGGGATRNAVIGKVHRLGINHETRAAVLAPTKRPEPLIVLGQPKPSRNATLQPPEPEPAPEPAPEAEAPPPAFPERPSRVPLLALDEDMCRWPLGDPGTPTFGFCGAERQPLPAGSRAGATRPPYCACHAEIAYRPRVSGRTA